SASLLPALSSACSLRVLLFRLPPRCPLFPYTTLFRSPGAPGPGGPAPGPGGQWGGPPREAGFFQSLFDFSFRRYITMSFARVLRSEDTRLNSSHVSISYAVFCLTKKSRMRKRTDPPQQ